MDSRHLCTLSPSARENEGATKYLHLHVFWHWLSPQKHTPAYPGAPFPLKYESFFCSLLLTSLRLKWILYIAIKSHHFTIFFWPLQCSSGNRDSSSEFLRISLTRIKNKQTSKQQQNTTLFQHEETWKFTPPAFCVQSIASGKTEGRRPVLRCPRMWRHAVNCEVTRMRMM